MQVLSGTTKVITGCINGFNFVLVTEIFINDPLFCSSVIPCHDLVSAF